MRLRARSSPPPPLPLPTKYTYARKAGTFRPARPAPLPTRAVEPYGHTPLAAHRLMRARQTAVLCSQSDATAAGLALVECTVERPKTNTRPSRFLVVSTVEQAMATGAVRAYDIVLGVPMRALARSARDAGDGAFCVAPASYAAATLRAAPPDSPTQPHFRSRPLRNASRRVPTGPVAALFQSRARVGRFGARACGFQLVWRQPGEHPPVRRPGRRRARVLLRRVHGPRERGAACADAAGAESVHNAPALSGQFCLRRGAHVVTRAGRSGPSGGLVSRGAPVPPAEARSLETKISADKNRDALRAPVRFCAAMDFRYRHICRNPKFRKLDAKKFTGNGPECHKPRLKIIQSAIVISRPA